MEIIRVSTQEICNSIGHNDYKRPGVVRTHCYQKRKTDCRCKDFLSRKNRVDRKSSEMSSTFFFFFSSFFLRLLNKNCLCLRSGILAKTSWKRCHLLFHCLHIEKGLQLKLNRDRAAEEAWRHWGGQKDWASSLRGARGQCPKSQGPSLTAQSVVTARRHWQFGEIF